MTKTIYTLAIDGYDPRITALTFPLMEEFARKIGAEFHIITERKFPGWPAVYEKLQIFELGRHSDWNWFFDADALIHPEMFDVTEMIPKDTVCHNGKDFASMRWSYDNFFRRDGRHVGSCNWCTVASNWCVDLWHPLEDLTLEEAVQRIHPTIDEEKSGFCLPEHLIDDYTLSRNIARYGLKCTTIAALIEQWKITPYLWHKYAMDPELKLREMLAILSGPPHEPVFSEPGELLNPPPGMPPAVLTPDKRIVKACGAGWGLMDASDLQEYREQWGIDRMPGDMVFPNPINRYAQPIPEIQGWMTPAELQWLYEQGRTHRIIAEVGCWFGRSTHALLSGNWDAFGDDGRVYAVDTFLGTPSERDTTHAFAKDGDVLAEFQRNCGHFRNLVVCQIDSRFAAQGKTVDMVFIDGDHSYDAVLCDLQSWTHTVAPGGLLCGHDAGTEGVKRALWRFFSEPPKIAPQTSIWHVNHETSG